jgi:hypothetical protein
MGDSRVPAVAASHHDMCPEPRRFIAGAGRRGPERRGGYEPGDGLRLSYTVPRAIRWPRVRTMSKLPSRAGVAKMVSLNEFVAFT